jgi:ribosome biogenesis GTPase
LNDATSLIDSPGLQEFGLFHLRPNELADAFVEFRQCAAACRFSDCRHTGEPNCAVVDAVSRGAIDARRYEAYRQILADLTSHR